jgi:hypothetical protein
MKLELLTVMMVGAIMFNTYHGGKYTKSLFAYKKYVQMAGIAIAGFSVYLMFKRSPDKSKNMLLYASNMVKYMPINRNAVSAISPLFDLTSGGSNPGGFMGTTNEMATGNKCEEYGLHDAYVANAHRGASKTTKRSVSETKKKYVASSQDWKCGSCQKQLNAWFEVDHKLRLDQGGSNDVTNLVAMCRECHGGKTAMENM